MSPPQKSLSEVATSGTLAIVSQLQVPMKPGSRATAVEHQLRTGIGIGVLEAGTRLPSEQIMAQHMGVSSLTFRQALDRLREDGLVTTKPGRGGGTFINASLSTLELLAREALAATSLAEIADIGQSVAELYASAARLAAQRRDENDLAELEVSLERLIEPMSAVARRRAGILYVITIARIARAESLLAALVPLIGKFLLMTWTDENKDFVNDLNEAATWTVKSVHRAEPDNAASAALEHIQHVEKQVIIDRSQIFADYVASDVHSPRDAFQELQQQLHNVKRSLLEGIQRLSKLDAPLYARGEPADDVDKILKRVATQNSALLRGAGIAYAPGLLKNARLWMDWWDSDYGRELTFKSHDFNARSLQYYDYEHMLWYTEPLRTKDFSLVGPYLDRGGIETSTITASLAISTGPFSGCVIGADLHIPAIEQILLDNSPDTTMSHVLVNSSNRVLVSTSPSAMHGTLLNAETLDQYDVVSQETGKAVTQWRLLRKSGEYPE